MWGSKGKKWLQLHEGGEVTLSPPQFSPPLSFLLSFLFSLLLNYFSPLSFLPQYILGETSFLISIFV